MADTEAAKQKAKGFFGEFRTFIMRGNVMDLAVGVIIGGAFQAIINSLVNDIIMPLITMATGGIDFTNWFVALDGGEYYTLAEAQVVSMNPVEMNTLAFLIRRAKFTQSM